MAQLTYEEANHLLRYDPDTGKLYWRIYKKGRNMRNEAGCINKLDNRRSIRIDYKLYRTYRLVWLLHYKKWPTKELDHKDGNSLNNKIDNLREATRSQNLGNSKRSLRNKSGFKGVSWNKNAQKYIVEVKHKYVGLFNTAEEAHEAYKKAAIEAFGEFARFE